MAGRRNFIKKLAAISVGSMSLKAYAKIAPKSVSHFETLTGEEYWNALRTQFTLKPEKVYLNNGTIGPSPLVVQQALINSIEQIDSSCAYGGDDIAREGISKLINCQKEEIALTHNTTEGLNIICWGLPLKKGDEVILTQHEHVGNIMPWLNRAEIDGIKLKFIKTGRTTTEVLNQLNDSISRKTRVISVPHVSCTIGQKYPIKAIQKLCKEKGIWFVPDGAHGAGSMHLDMQDLDVDCYVSCGHKWLLGPKGTGFVFIKKGFLDTIKPTYAGAYTDSGFDIFSTHPILKGYNKTAHRFDYGTKNASLFIGLNEATNFHLNIGTKKVEERCLSLSKYLFTKLETLESQVQIINSNEQASRSSMIGFVPKSIDYKTLANKLQDNGFRVRQVPEANLNSIRVSTHIYNNFEQLDVFCDAIKEIG
ncbi:MAG: aminotransferase class V-fold PLP-dependent enzyme [Bacteroidetes bacterium]|nr:aminotransferase class V-fold PLP-dependent enzyme [Bacteroidota bacterium]